MTFSKLAVRVFLIAVVALCAEFLAAYLLVPSRIISIAAGNILAWIIVCTLAIGAAALFFGIIYPPIARFVFNNVLAEHQRLYLLEFRLWRLILEVEPKIKK